MRGSLTAAAVAVTCFPFMLWTVLAAVEDTDPNLVPAAATLGADPVEQFLFVRLPLLAPGIVTGALVVFAVIAADFMVSQVLTTIDNQTFAGVRIRGFAGCDLARLGRGLGILDRRGGAPVRRGAAASERELVNAVCFIWRFYSLCQDVACAWS